MYRISAQALDNKHDLELDGKRLKIREAGKPETDRSASLALIDFQFVKMCKRREERILDATFLFHLLIFTCRQFISQCSFRFDQMGQWELLI